jgi:tryptophan-rich sensory protein
MNPLPIIIVSIVAVINSMISSKNLKWFNSKEVIRSPHTPPGYVFGIVWTFIYIAFTYVWITSSNELGDNLFLISIFLNFLWVFVFFGQHEFNLSRYIILALLLVTIYQAGQQWYINNTVGTFIMLVYCSWLICATGLNFETKKR